MVTPPTLVLLTALTCPFQSQDCNVVTSVGYVPIDDKFEPSKLTGNLSLPHSVFKSSFLAECGPQPQSAAPTLATLLLPDNSSQRTTPPPFSRWPRASSKAKDDSLAACREELSPAGASAVDPATRPVLIQTCLQATTHSLLDATDHETESPGSTGGRPQQMPTIDVALCPAGVLDGLSMHSDELHAAQAARNNSGGIAASKHQRARPCARDPAVAGGDAFLIKYIRSPPRPLSWQPRPSSPPRSPPSPPSTPPLAPQLGV